MKTQAINGQIQIIGNIEIQWALTPRQTFSVTVYKTHQSTLPVKEWEFEENPINEAVSYCWFDYVTRSLDQQHRMGHQVIPEFLLSTSSNDVNNLINMVFEKL